MIEPSILQLLGDAISSGIDVEKGRLDALLDDVRELKPKVKKIQPRSATAISLVGSDGGNNKIEFDPFLFQIVRVVDSSENEYCMEVVTPSMEFQTLEQRHIQDGAGKTSLGKLAMSLGLKTIEDLSPVFKADAEQRSTSWVQVYRHIMEWAVLFEFITSKDFATDTVIVHDGFLRSKMFSNGLFGTLKRLIDQAITAQYKKNRRNIYLVGIAKHSKFLLKYRLAMAVEGVLRNAFPAYLKVPQKLEKQVYKWSEYATGGAERESYVMGEMHLVKFGPSAYSPVWAIDILKSQVDQAYMILGYLLADAKDGFPVPHYPQCLQRAHERAALVDFDLDILQDQVSSAVTKHLGARGSIVDELALQVSDPSGLRYFS